MRGRRGVYVEIRPPGSEEVCETFPDEQAARGFIRQRWAGLPEGTEVWLTNHTSHSGSYAKKGGQRVKQVEEAGQDGAGG